MKSIIEISASKLLANYAALQEAAAPGFELLCVLKADAYGHSAELCAPLLAGAGARWLGVNDLEEGLRIRIALAEAGIKDPALRIVVMGGFEPGDALPIVDHFLTPVVWTPAHIEALDAAAAQANLRLTVHVEIDTGMGRQGVVPGAELTVLLDTLRRAKRVRCEGVFSHLSSSEVNHSPETIKQIDRFGAALEQVFERNVIPEFVHLGNSSAVDEGSALSWIRNLATTDMSATPLVRPGLSLYGYLLPLVSAEGKPATSHLRGRLQPVATWKTRIIGLRDLAAGDTVGYGATFTAARPMRVALLPVGYADGLRREASSGAGNGWVMIDNQRAPVVGRVSMNLTVVDVSEHPPATALGDEVILLGDGVTADDHAAWCRTIPYEILCGMRGIHRLA